MKISHGYHIIVLHSAKEITLTNAYSAKIY